jgi:predicted nucleic acid-binding protein
VRFLVDANVLSEPTRARPDAGVVAWINANKGDASVNPVILGEIEFGILLLPAGRRRRALIEWFDDAIRAIHVLDIDAITAAEWAVLLAELRRKGRAMPVKDSLIAATARQHSLTVATRNVTDYRYAGVKVVNPFRA